ncbi:fasciclin domain-containing protein [uncultured Polaribacter sp.]|uniref:fasciclin domain-containing protein n=1 Tax=uncultured Polaribacter sp. TaxID=174711 RepID=UPI0026305E69|nr:fasciclin domain-containing protein [uncultured Polaribacter sp.]
MRTDKIRKLLVSLLLLAIIIISCDDKLDNTTFFTTDEKTILQTLESDPDKFSMYVDILRKTKFDSAFKSYGSYTCLAPTNTAIKTYLQENFNVGSVDELTSEDQIEFLKIVVKFHTLPTQRYTSSFIEGRLADTTYTGDFLTTSYLDGGGISNVKINREIGLDQYDIEASNGIIHALDGVLLPFIDPIPKVIEKAGKHTIFIEALKQTGYYEIFSVIFDTKGAKNNFTILAESDVVYAQEGIHSFDDLANLISPGDTDYTNPNNELNRFMGYHATESFLYTADFPADSFINTILPKNAIKSFKTDKELKLNETETGVNDTWTSLIPSESNYPAKNGVYHTVDKLFTIFIPKAKYVIFDFATGQPEVQSGAVGFGRWYNDPTIFSRLRVFPATRIRILRQSRNAAYDAGTVLNLGSVTWIEFDTPVLPKGKYELRVCGNQGNNGRPIFQTYWDGQPIGSQWDMRVNPSELGIGWPNEDSTQLRDRGYVRGLRDVFDNTGTSAYDIATWARFIITDELLMPEQQSHVLRFETVRSGGIPIDYVEFVPVD